MGKEGEENAEQWKNIAEYEGRYQVSDHGRIRSLNRRVVRNDGVTLRLKGKIKKQGKHRQGYMLIDLSKAGEKKTYLVHRLVAEAFVDNPKDKLEVNHKDGDKKNNHARSLEWCTPQENSLHTYHTELRDRPRGELNGRSKLNRFQVKRVRLMRQLGTTYAETGRIFKLNPVTIRDVCLRKLWKHIN